MFDPKGKIFLAPMVRVSTHPMRLLALKYGADYVCSEEIVDQRILRSKRVVNDELDTIDYIMPDGTVVFRTSVEEKGRVIVQLGTASAERAIKCGQMLQDDVVAIDVNMGCPKAYSIKGGMGVALLTQPEKVKEILTGLTKSLRIPVTCKIRILPKLEDTLTLVQLIQSTGVAALTVHGRYPSERPHDRNHDEVIRAIAERLSIPVIANGGSCDTIRLHDDIEFFRLQTGASGVMIARAAMWNPSIFSAQQPSPLLHDVIREYLSIALRFGHHVQGTKYCIQQMLHMEGDTPLFLDTLAARDIKDLCFVWGLEEEYHCEMQRRTNVKLRRNSDINMSDFSDIALKRPRSKSPSGRTQESIHTVRKSLPFERKFWPNPVKTPKHILITHCRQHKLEPPKFDTKECPETRLFFSTVTVNAVKFENLCGCKSRKHAEQAAALVCLDYLDIPNGNQYESFCFSNVLTCREHVNQGRLMPRTL